MMNAPRMHMNVNISVIIHMEHSTVPVTLDIDWLIIIRHVMVGLLSKIISTTDFTS